MKQLNLSNDDAILLAEHLAARVVMMDDQTNSPRFPHWPAKERRHYNAKRAALKRVLAQLVDDPEAAITASRQAGAERHIAAMRRADPIRQAVLSHINRFVSGQS